jgi:hypothetical protein
VFAKLGGWGRLGARERTVARSRADLGQWHITLSHEIEIYMKFHVRLEG